MSEQTVASPPKFRSVSQVLDMDRCPHMYYLKRIRKAWSRPAAWLPQGIAVHHGVELFEKSGRTMTLTEVQKEVGEKYDDEVNALCEVTPNFAVWFASGPYTGELDIVRRYGIAQDQAEKYYDFRMVGAGSRSWPALMPDGKPGVEYDFEVEFGDVPVRGYIDYIDEWFRPDDVKTGNKPGDRFQLETYAGAIEKLTGVKPTTGTFWMGKTGKQTLPADLSHVTQEYLTDVFGAADERIKAEQFEAKPEPSKCMFCSVRTACSFSAA